MVNTTTLHTHYIRTTYTLQMESKKKGLLKAMYQRHKHYQNRGTWHRVNMCYHRFYGKDSVEEYFEFVKKIDKKL